MTDLAFPFTADLSDRVLLLEAAQRRISEPYSSGPDHLHDNWHMLLECVAEATGRSDLLDCPRSGPAFDAVSGSTARMVLVQWGFREVQTAFAQPGDLILFAMGQGAHVAVLAERRGENLGVIHKNGVRHCGFGWPLYTVASAWTLDRPTTPAPKVHPEIMGILSGFTPLAKVAETRAAQTLFPQPAPPVAAQIKAA